MEDGESRSDHRPYAISHEPSAISFLANKLPEHIRQDPAMPERDQLLGGVDTRDGLELDHVAVLPMRVNRNDAARPQPLRDPGELITLLAGQPDGRRRRAALELQRQHAHVDEVAAVDALEA